MAKQTTVAISALLLVVLVGGLIFYYPPQSISASDPNSSCGVNQFATSESSGVLSCANGLTVMASGTLIAQTTTQTIVSFTSPSGAATTYEVPCYLEATSLVSTLLCQVVYTEAITGASQTITFVTDNAANNPFFSTGFIWAAPSTLISIQARVAVSSTYNAAASIIRVS